MAVIGITWWEEPSQAEFFNGRRKTSIFILVLTKTKLPQLLRINNQNAE